VPYLGEVETTIVSNGHGFQNSQAGKDLLLSYVFVSLVRFSLAVWLHVAFDFSFISAHRTVCAFVSVCHCSVIADVARSCFLGWPGKPLSATFVAFCLCV
jgi:hypothetical protein